MVDLRDALNATAELTRLVEQLRTVTANSDRPDLAARLDTTMQRMADPSVRVLVVGEFKQGKSLLVNALINAPVCPVDDDDATAVPTIVRHGDEPTAMLVYTDLAEGPADDGSRALRRQQIAVDELAHHVTERSTADKHNRLVCAEVTVPSALLESGLVLVDTPGVGGIGAAHAAGTIAELPTAHAVLMVSDAAQEYSQPEMDFLRQAAKLCPNVACVLTKTDLYPQWERIAELNRGHLEAAGLKVPLVPLSSTLRIHALATQDRELNTESGFPVLVGYVRRGIIDNAEHLARRSVAHDVQYVVEHLSLSFQGELAVLRDEDGDKELVAGLETARARAEGLRQSSAQWKTTLNDGMTDLHADIEYDIRDRTRLIIRDAEEIIDSSDPAKISDQFAEWFRQRVSEAVADNFVWAHERAEWLAQQVADHFAELTVDMPVLHATDTERVLEPVPPLPSGPPDKLSLAGKVLIGMRGSYGGVLMFGLLTGLAGMALINPLSLGAGVILGKRTYNEDRANRLSKRRFDAKVVVRRQIDDVILHVTKQAKDRLRQVQRLLRDHFTVVAGELTQSMTDAVNAANAAVRTNANDRQRRIGEISESLAQLDSFRRRADVLSRLPAGQQPVDS